MYFSGVPAREDSYIKTPQQPASFPKAHNGSQFFLGGGLLPTSSSIEVTANRADHEPLQRKCWLTLPLLSYLECDRAPRLACVQTVSQEPAVARPRAALCFNEPGSQGDDAQRGVGQTVKPSFRSKFLLNSWLVIYIIRLKSHSPNLTWWDGNIHFNCNSLVQLGNDLIGW